MNSFRKSLIVFFATVLFATVAYIIVEIVSRIILYCVSRFQRAPNPSATGDAGYDHNVTVVVEDDSRRDGRLPEIPVLIYGELPASSPSCSTGSDTCPVCLADYTTGEEVRVLPRCRHMFHKDCIDRWFITSPSFCPVCRDRVIDHVVKVGDINGSGANRSSSSSQNREGDDVGYPQSLRLHLVRVAISVMPFISSSNL